MRRQQFPKIENDNWQCISIGYSILQCMKIGSGLIFGTVRPFRNFFLNFFPAALPARINITASTNCDACG